MGQERLEDIRARVKEAWRRIREMGHENLIVVTHRVFLKSLMPEVLGMELTKKEDGGYILIEAAGDGNRVLGFDGIEVGRT